MASQNDAADAAANALLRRLETAKRIRILNDAFRVTLSGGKLMITTGIDELGPERVAHIIEQVRRCADFGEENDPHGEHDFGSLINDGQRIFWKIDYYGRTLDVGSPDPSNPNLTTRVLTIMLAAEY